MAIVPEQELPNLLEEKISIKPTTRNQAIDVIEELEASSNLD